MNCFWLHNMYTKITSSTHLLAWECGCCAYLLTRFLTVPMKQQHCHFLFCHWPRWLTDCYYAESARSVWKMSVASRRPPPGQRRLVSPPPCSPPLLGSPSSPLHAPCPAVFLTRHAEKSPSTFRTKRTSQRGSSIANCLCWSTSMHSEYWGKVTGGL